MNMMRVNATVARNAAVALPARRNLAARGKPRAHRADQSQRGKGGGAFAPSNPRPECETPAARERARGRGSSTQREAY